MVSIEITRTGPRLLLTFSPECPVCRFSANYARALAKMCKVTIATYGWRDGDHYPPWIADYFYVPQKPGDEALPYLPYFADQLTGHCGAGEDAVVEFHRALFGKPGAFFGRWIALPTVKALMRIRKMWS